MAASLIQLVVIIVVVGLLLWLVNQYIPMEARLKQLLNVVVVVALVIYIAYALITAAGMVA